MQTSQQEALRKFSEADETFIDGVRVIRDSIITVVPNADKSIGLSSFLPEDISMNEAADVLVGKFEGQFPAETLQLVKDLLHDESEAGDKKVSLFALHGALDNAVYEGENIQKHTMFKA